MSCRSRDGVWPAAERGLHALVLRAWRSLHSRQAAPAMYLAKRPHARQRSVTWQRGGGGKSVGVRSIWPEQDGQLSGEPVRSFAIRWSACAGLNVAGLGLRIRYYLATAD